MVPQTGYPIIEPITRPEGTVEYIRVRSAGVDHNLRTSMTVEIAKPYSAIDTK